MAEGAGADDLRHPLLEKQVGGGETARAAVDAGRVVAVLAQVRRDEDVVRGGGNALQVGGELGQRHHVPVAARRIDDRVEVDERVVAHRVLVAGAGLLGRVGRADRRVTAGPGLGRRVPHVLHVALPGAARGRELIGDGRYEGRIHAALPDRLAVGVEARRADEVGVDLAVRLGVGIGCLAAHQRDVVVEAHVAGRVVLPQQLTLLGESLG